MEGREGNEKKRRKGGRKGSTRKEKKERGEREAMKEQIVTLFLSAPACKRKEGRNNTEGRKDGRKVRKVRKEGEEGRWGRKEGRKTRKAVTCRREEHQ